MDSEVVRVVIVGVRDKTTKLCTSKFWCYSVYVHLEGSGPKNEGDLLFVTGFLSDVQDAVQFKLSALQHQLSESVPASLLERANSQYSELVSRHQEVLQRQSKHTSATSTIDHLQVCAVYACNYCV